MFNDKHRPELKGRQAAGLRRVKSACFYEQIWVLRINENERKYRLRYDGIFNGTLAKAY